MAARVETSTYVIVIPAMIFGLFFLFGPLALVGFQYARGAIDGKDIRDIAGVLGGTRSYALTVDDIKHYHDLKRAEEGRQRKLAEEKGGPATRLGEARALRERKKESDERFAAATANLSQELEKLQRLRTEVEALKKQQADERAALEELKRANTSGTLQASQENLVKLFPNMDAENISRFLENLIREGNAVEAARWVRTYMRPDLAAEVMGEMPEADRQQILPLMENKFAGQEPEKVARAWEEPVTGQPLVPAQMAEYLKKMNALQALRVYLALRPATKGKVVQILRVKKR